MRQKRCECGAEMDYCPDNGQSYCREDCDVPSPSEFEIRLMCNAIQATWDDETEWKRRVQKCGPVRARTMKLVDERTFEPLPDLPVRRRRECFTPPTFIEVE